MGGRVLAIDHDLPSVTFVTPSADQLHFQFTRTSDRLDDPFEIRPGTIIPVGNYTWNRFQADLFTTRSRPVSTAITVRHLGFYTGHRRDYSAVLEWRASPHCSTSLSGELRRVRLPQGNFDVRVATVRAVYTFTPDLQLSLLAQYDNLSGSLGANLRLRWTLQPGNDLFLIVNQGYDTTADHFRPVQNTIALKTAWTLRF